MTVPLQRRADQLISVADSTLAPGAVPDPDTFTDEHGRRRPVDGPLLSWIARRPCPTPPFTSTIDVHLWHAVTGATSGPCSQALESARRAGTVADLIRPADDISLEVATEAQLCALHALTRLARRDPALRPLITRSVLWLIDEVQPDNATNHPWAIHAFARFAAQPHHPRALDAGLYFESLLHNAQVTRGRPDLRSAWILRDAAAELTERPAHSEPPAEAGGFFA